MIVKLLLLSVRSSPPALLLLLLLLLSLPLRLVSLSLSLRLSFGATFIWALPSEGRAVNPNINNEWNRVVATIWPPVYVCVCVRVCIRSLCVCVCVGERRYLIGGRWWRGAALCLPPSHSPSGRCGRPRSAWSSETHRDRRQCPERVWDVRRTQTRRDEGQEEETTMSLM